MTYAARVPTGTADQSTASAAASAEGLTTGTVVAGAL